jgi:hypothetical protein
LIGFPVEFDFPQNANKMLKVQMGFFQTWFTIITKAFLQNAKILRNISVFFESTVLALAAKGSPNLFNQAKLFKFQFSQS